LPWLSFINKLPKAVLGLITGLLPAVALAVLMSLVPGAAGSRVSRPSLVSSSSHRTPTLHSRLCRSSSLPRSPAVVRQPRAS
jgi:hypothetical protein